ncbi:YtxH domain-containing protein [Flavobacterium sp.]|uniref:YtxH domain-containing protein n=1 Tax=Flavobacterium sp. TaxID=239 RepID=UPI002CC5C114|nr:YtxH domain-containing protein [Flavobacterium sp.]HSD07990.1 YtxH domain-containing protein [Flavobacterium sp.]
MVSTKGICALLTGVAIGATVGMLFAPEKGEDLRNKIADIKSDYLNKLKDKLSNITNSSTSDSSSANQPA